MKITVDINKQLLLFQDDDSIVKEYRIATSKNGVGEQFGSECTPRGQHIVRAKIGGGVAENSVFVGRRITGEVFSEALREQHPNRDWILTRILWLSGTETGYNRLGDVDTMRRFIYIHGCPDSDAMGIPSSHGCIKMRNTDIIQLFDKVDVGTSVLIKE